MSLKFQRAILVGASSGIGAEIARQLAAGGTAVALVGHRADELAGVASEINAAGKGRAVVGVHDVTEYDTAPELFERLVGELGGLDLLLYAAGIQTNTEEGVYDFEADRAMMEINFIGAMRWTHLAAARFEAQRGGTIVAISSIAGERGRRTMQGYSTSKAALTAWMEALRNRIARYGVNVVTVKPGMVDTILTRHLDKKPMIISAPRAASLILAAARRGDSASAFIPLRWWFVAMILRHMPSWLFRKLDL